MTSDQIREMETDNADSTNQILREIAAQLAEMNEREAATETRYIYRKPNP